MSGVAAEPTRPWLVYVMEPIADEALAALRQRARVILGYGPGSRPLPEVLPDIDGLIVRRSAIKADLIERASRLRVIARPGVGYESVDLAAVTERGIPFLITKDANHRSVAELVFALTLSVLRGIPRWDRICRSGGFAHREQLLGRELYGKRFGLIGIGRVGSEVARIARHGFDLDVLAYHPTKPAEEVRAIGATPVRDLHTFLGECDLVSLQVPLTDRTRNLIAAPELARMRPDSILINVARGGIVDEAALVDALAAGRIGGAGIDVFEAEPPPLDHPLFGLDNVVVSPHRAGRTSEAVRRMGSYAVRGLLLALDGDLAAIRADDSPVTLVNPSILSQDLAGRI